jgi:hypothetical protein
VEKENTNVIFIKPNKPHKCHLFILTHYNLTSTFSKSTTAALPPHQLQAHQNSFQNKNVFQTINPTALKLLPVGEF